LFSLYTTSKKMSRQKNNFFQNNFCRGKLQTFFTGSAQRAAPAAGQPGTLRTAGLHGVPAGGPESRVFMGMVYPNLRECQGNFHSPCAGFREPFSLTAKLLFLQGRFPC
jgi:hypothetical protein